MGNINGQGKWGILMGREMGNWVGKMRRPLKHYSTDILHGPTIIKN